MKALCEVVAAQYDEQHTKVGEEVRFYIDSAHVRTMHIIDPAQFGTYTQGVEYEIEEAALDAEKAPDSEIAPVELEEPPFEIPPAAEETV